MPTLVHRSRKLHALLLSVAVLVALVAVPAAAQTATPTDAFTFYVPFPESDADTVFSELLTGWTGDDTPDDHIVSVISIAVSGNGTVIYYDHHEDGFQPTFVGAPAGTVLIWGDGDASNGVPLGDRNGDSTIDDLDDFLLAGDVIALRDDIPLPDSSATLRFDGGDKLGASRPIAVTRIAWDIDAGALLAGAVEVYAVSEYGTQYVLPIGENLATIDEGMFSRTYASIMASEDNTLVEARIAGGSGTWVAIGTINEGESLLYPQSNAGLEIRASSPVQVHLATGQTYAEGGKFESRWFSLSQDDFLGGEYFTPASTTVQGTGTLLNPTSAFVYNPNAATISVWVESSGAATFCADITGFSTQRFDLPGGAYTGTGSVKTGDGTHLIASATAVCNVDPVPTSSDTEISAVAAVNALPQADTSAPDNDTWDWGYSLIPVSRLTTQGLVGWGPGFDLADPTGATSTVNGSPIWVIATVDGTTVVADWDGADVSVVLDKYETVQFADPDLDNTGTRIFSLQGPDGVDKPIAIAWGENSEVANVARPFLDVGTSVYPLPAFTLRKEVALADDVDMNGVYDAGDTVLYTINVINEKQGALRNIRVWDILPDSLIYEEGTTSLLHPDGTRTAIADDDPADDPTPFPLDGDGVVIGDLSIFEDGYQVSFEATIRGDLEVEYGEMIINNACAVATNAQEDCDDSTFLIHQPAIDLEKSVIIDDGVSDLADLCADAEQSTTGATGTAIYYCFTITNTGNTYLSDLVFVDDDLSIALGDLTLVSGSTALMAPGDSAVYAYSSTIGDAYFLNTADVTGNPTDNQGNDLPGVDDVTDDDDAEVTPWDPSIEIVKDPDNQTVRVGGTAMWNITVTNTGNVLLTNVTVTDTIAPDCDHFIGDLEPGVENAVTYTCELQDVTEDFTNVAVVKGDDPDGEPVEDDDDADVDVTNPGISIDKAAKDGTDSQTVRTDGTATWDITVTNTGDIDLENVTVTDELAPGCDSVIGDLAVGESTSYECTLDNVQADFTNVADVTGDPTDGGDPVTDDDPSDVVVRDPGITITKSATDGTDSQTLRTGGTATWDITVTNTGDIDLENVTVTDDLAPGCDNVIGDLAVGESTSYECTLDNVQADFTNVADVTGDPTDGGDPVTDDDPSDVVVRDPGITITKSATDGTDLQTFRVGGTATWDITVTNTGQVDLTNVTVTDALAPLCDSVIGDLAVGASTTYQCTLADVQADFTNVADVTGDPTDGGDPVTDTDPSAVDVYNPAISIVKSAIDGTDEQAVPNGGTATWTIVVTNTGDVELTNVVVTDPLAPNCVNDIGTLAIGASVSYTCTLDGVTEDFTNTAFVTGTPPDGGDVTDDDPSSVTVPPPIVTDLDGNRTIGFWKNHCNRFKKNNPDAIDQMPVMLGDQLGIPDPDTIADDGTFDADQACEDSGNILDSRDLDGQKHAEDAAYNLASQLLAAKYNANLSEGTTVCAAVGEAIGDADALLAAVGFNGTGDYLVPGDEDTAEDRATAIVLADILDRYNNSDMTACE